MGSSLREVNRIVEKEVVDVIVMLSSSMSAAESLPVAPWVKGVLTDWIKWALGRKTPMRHGPPAHRPAWTRYFGVDFNHKVIGIQYTVTAVLVLLIGGTLAMIFRLELVYPGMQFLNPDQFNTMFSAHGIIMIASILLGVGGMVNYLVPLMIGASDMAFPRLNAFSFWIAVPAALLIVAGIFVSFWWRQLLRKYQLLIRLRFNVLWKMEEKEELEGIEKMYHKEDELYPRNEDGTVIQGKGLNFSDLENKLPAMFIVLYSVALVGVLIALAIY